MTRDSNSIVDVKFKRTCFILMSTCKIVIKFIFHFAKRKTNFSIDRKWIVPMEYQVENLCDPVLYCNNCSIMLSNYIGVVNK